MCILDDEPTTSGRTCGLIDPSVCQSQKVSFSIAVMIQPESGPVCLLGTEFQKKVCWEILVAGSEQGIEAGQVGLRLITKGDRQTTVAKEWSISATSIADGRFEFLLNVLGQFCHITVHVLSISLSYNLFWTFLSPILLFACLCHGCIVLLSSIL